MRTGLLPSRRLLARGQVSAPPPNLEAYWALEPTELFRRLRSGPEGLSSAEALDRLNRYGANELREQRPLSRLAVLANQLRSPLLLLLLFAAAVSLLTGQWTEATIVLVIVLASVVVGYRREYRAQASAAALQGRVKTRTTLLRDGQPRPIPMAQVVPGDVALLSAGSLIPGDAVILEASDCFVSEAVLTGESFPTQKQPGALPAATPLGKRTGCGFLGTNLRSGTARCLVVHTGAATEFGAIAHRLSLRPPETEFDRGIRHFGYLLTTAMLVMVLLVFAAHMLQGRPVVETLLFSIALAVGLSPELLPAILSVNLARGAEMMARAGVLVRHLSAIENLGSMDILCTDKTGTLTEGVVTVDGAYDPAGEKSTDVLELAALNASLETGLSNPLDEAILQACTPTLPDLHKLAEIPFDFVRKRVSVVVEEPAGIRLVTKGAFHQVLEVCSRLPEGTPLDVHQRARLESIFDRWSRLGLRVLAVASRVLAAQTGYHREDERDLTFHGFVTFLDRPKAGVEKTIAELAGLGVAIKIITGDSRAVAEHVASLVGLPGAQVLTGADLDQLHDEALWREAERTDLFVEVDPNQKERIILSLKKMGHVVGFLGDGVNDAPAMHAADTSLSVEQAVDVAREAADFVLLERDLQVIRRGIVEGRRTFANTLKYILTTTSANLGNMVSMAAASLFLPFLPLLAGQILLNNFLSDIPALGLAGDSVDPELISRPRRWDMRFIGRFMIQFGLVSSLFDFLCFGVLLLLFQAGPALFQTGWFVQSLLTELVIALVVRTRRPFFRSRPGRLLLVSTLVLIVVAVLIPYLPHVALLGFVPLPIPLLVALAGITALYVLATELLKVWFYRRLT
jgi:P-type Mg2+ transporter